MAVAHARGSPAQSVDFVAVKGYCRRIVYFENNILN